MSTLDRYLGIAILKGYLLVLAVLLTLFGFVAFIEELEDVGDGHYRILDAILYVLMTMPDRLLDLSPIVALLGSLVALADLARSSELIAMRAAGVSVRRIGWAVMQPAIAFMLIALVTMELVAPPMYQAAERWRAESLVDFGAGEVLKDKGFWAREESRFVNVRRLLMGRIPADVDVYEFDETGRIQRHLHAERADLLEGGDWRLVNVVSKTMDGTELVSRRVPELDWKPFWEHDPMDAQLLPVASLSLTELDQYLAYLDEVGQEGTGVALTYWRKRFQPLLIGVMALLSVSFVLGDLRGASFGRRLALGAIVGVLFFLGSQLLYNLGLVLGFSAALVALTPVLLIGIAAAVLLWRIA